MTNEDLLIRLLIQARMALANVLEQAGGCDHGVGICMCNDLNLVNHIDAKLANDQGVSLIYAFWEAAPMDKKKEWAKAGALALQTIAAEYAQDMED
jgi:hypothetical protein